MKNLIEDRPDGSIAIVLNRVDGTKEYALIDHDQLESTDMLRLQGEPA
jgi:hypothetical protein